MTISLAHITFDCTDAAVLASFWSGVLDHPVDPDANQFFATVGLRSEPALKPAWMFIAVPEGKTAKNRVHVDLRTADLPTESARVEALGATRIGDFDEYGTKWSTFLDPEGNEFDIGAGMG